MEYTISFFFVLLAGLCGGIFAKYLKMPVLVGYILGGLVFSTFLPQQFKNVTGMAEIGTILLLFSIGLELSFDRLSKFFKISIIGGLAQILVVTLSLWLILVVAQFNSITSFILAFGFALSSTAVVIKMLNDKNELDTLHGGIMFGWLLVQDLAVIPMMVFLPAIKNGFSADMFLPLIKSILILTVAIFLARKLVPFLIHKISSQNSRELLVLSSVVFAFGTATLTYYLGLSASIGAFLAGVVISETYEHHAVFAETRVLKDIFLSLFFVSLGFLLNIGIVAANILTILGLMLAVIVIKFIITHILTSVLEYKGRTAFAVSFGLSQIGEFAFVIFTASLALGYLNYTDASIGIAVTLGTLLISPLIYKNYVGAWRYVRNLTKSYPAINKYFSANIKKIFDDNYILENHIIICGYGRVGSWIGKALKNAGVSFVIIEYNQKVIDSLEAEKIPALYGDPAEPEILDEVSIRNAKAIVLAIPDAGVQENLVAHVQTVAPHIHIISRAHLASDIAKLKLLKVDKIIQPEFEAALAIIRSVLSSLGKPKEVIVETIQGLRVSQGMKFSNK